MAGECPTNITTKHTFHSKGWVGNLYEQGIINADRFVEFVRRVVIAHKGLYSSLIMLGHTRKRT